MKITFYGTAAAEGVPALYCDCPICEKARAIGGKEHRTRSQALINDDLLIDYPADTYLHVLRNGLPLHKITDVLITHCHQDHLYPQEIMMRSPGFANLKDGKTLNFYGGSEVNEVILNIPKLAYMQEKNIIRVHEVFAFKEFETTGGYKIIPLDADHSTRSPFIYLISKDGKTILYAHDTGYFPESTMKYLKERKPHVDFATFDCCYSLMHCEKGHMGFDEVRIMENRLRKIGVTDENTVLCINHFSHNNGQLYEDMKKYSEKYGYLTSYDGMEKEF